MKTISYKNLVLSLLIILLGRFTSYSQCSTTNILTEDFNDNTANTLDAGQTKGDYAASCGGAIYISNNADACCAAGPDSWKTSTSTPPTGNDGGGTGDYALLIDGCSSIPDGSVWCTSVTVAPGETYHFSAFFSSPWLAERANDPDLYLTINGLTISSVAIVEQYTSNGPTPYMQLGCYYQIPAGTSGSVNFCINMKQRTGGISTSPGSGSYGTNGQGNDILLDNIKIDKVIGAGCPAAGTCSITGSEINIKAGATSIASAGSFDFGTSNVGAATAATTFTIENLGIVNLTLSGSPKVAISGTNAADFTIVQSGVSSPVSVSGTTMFTITFNPSAAGARIAAITIVNDDSDEGTYVINLTGIGVQCTFTGFTEDFGTPPGGICSGAQGAANPYVVNHCNNCIGGPAINDGEYAISCDGTNFNAGWHGGTGSYIEDHTVAGQGGYFLLVNSAAGPVEYYHRTISGLCANTTYTLTYYAGNIVRDNVYGNPPSLQAYIFPAGTAVSGVGTFSAAGGTLLGSTGSIPSETSANGFKWNAYSYNFTTGAGVTSIDIVLVSLSGNSAGYDFVVDDINVTGTTPGPEINVKAGTASVTSGGSFNFGNSNVGTATSATTFTIENLGTVNLTLSGSPRVGISGTDAGDFTIVQSGVSSPVSASGSTTFTITFTPSATGARTAAISINNDDSDEGTYVINLTGTGTVGLPVSQTITGPTTVNANQTSVTYSVSAPPSGSTYSWSLPPGSIITSASSDSSSVTVTFGTTSGDVAVTETNSAGSTTSTLAVTINNATGISSGLGSDSYSNYPSPFSEETVLKINTSVNTPLSVKIITLKGNSVFESNEFYTNEDIKLGKGLASGVYMLQISYGSKIQVIKIVKL